MTPSESAPRSALSRDQHRAALWGDPSIRVYAVALADRWPALAAPTPPDLPEIDCLLPGVLTPEVARAAPWLMRLDRDTPLTEWLLFDAPAELGEWGTLVLAAGGFVPLRNRLRGFCEARLPDGSPVPLAWMDPALLRCLLPLGDGPQLATLFGDGVAAFGLAEPGRITLYRAPLGQLVTTATAVAA